MPKEMILAIGDLLKSKPLKAMGTSFIIPWMVINNKGMKKLYLKFEPKKYEEGKPWIWELTDFAMEIGLL